MSVIAIVSQDKLDEARSGVKTALEEVSKEDYDERDVTDFMNNDMNTSYYVQWSKTIPEAVKLAVKSFKIRKDNQINDLTPDIVGIETMKKGYMFLLGRDVNGCRVLHMRTGKMEKKDKEANQKLMMLWLSRIQKAEPGKRVTFIMDTTGSSLFNSDMGFVTFIIDCFATRFPGLLEKNIIYNLPGVLNAMWKLVSKMLSPEQREVTIMCGKSEITKYIDEDNLPESMGGKKSFEYSYPPFPDELES
uniref:Motile sperm domain-containing protein 2 n=1 Tax=Ciona intestinalis TaxID=7719 RepID=F6Z1H7_CIOIN|nr:motile sperm domain-containing protein 2 [Ciona intestinalis]|eukprot:XP_009862000.1 motile sperm domain-containing protein 2 [Ciona intestinalis]